MLRRTHSATANCATGRTGRQHLRDTMTLCRCAELSWMRHVMVPVWPAVDLCKTTWHRVDWFMAGFRWMIERLFPWAAVGS